MIRPLVLALVVLCGLVCGLPALAANTTTVFPPYVFNTNRLPAATDGECVMTYLAGAATTYCRTQVQAFDFVFPDQATAQKVLHMALPGCAQGQYVAFNGANYVCKTIPICTTNQFLNFDGSNYICSTIALPICEAGKFLTSKDGRTFSCSGGSCTPNWQITGYGTCSASCGGGVRDVNLADGCGNTRTETEACNTQACPCTASCSGTIDIAVATGVPVPSVTPLPFGSFADQSSGTIWSSSKVGNQQWFDYSCSGGNLTITAFGDSGNSVNQIKGRTYPSNYLNLNIHNTGTVCNACAANGGKLINGYCFYLSSAPITTQTDYSCDAACASHGGCNANGTQWAAGVENCRQVAQTISGVSAVHQLPGGPLGCALGTVANEAFTPTSEQGVCGAPAPGQFQWDVNLYRYCACNQ